MSERQTILAGCLAARRQMQAALVACANAYDTPVGRRIAIEAAEVELWRWQIRANRYRRSTKAERDRAALVAWHTGRGMDGYDNIAAE